MSGISLASSSFTAGNVLPNTLTVNTGGNSHLYASKQAGGQNQKQQKQQKKKQQSRKSKKQSRKSVKKSRKSRQSRKN
jgi:hypothetical protein